jgi:hypothetical protein
VALELFRQIAGIPAMSKDRLKDHALLDSFDPGCLNLGECSVVIERTCPSACLRITVLVCVIDYSPIQSMNRQELSSACLSEANTASAVLAAFWLQLVVQFRKEEES